MSFVCFVLNGWLLCRSVVYFSIIAISKIQGQCWLYMWMDNLAIKTACAYILKGFLLE